MFSFYKEIFNTYPSLIRQNLLSGMKIKARDVWAPLPLQNTIWPRGSNNRNLFSHKWGMGVQDHSPWMMAFWWGLSCCLADCPFHHLLTWREVRDTGRERWRQTDPLSWFAGELRVIPGSGTFSATTRKVPGKLVEAGLPRNHFLPTWTHSWIIPPSPLKFGATWNSVLANGLRAEVMNTRP